MTALVVAAERVAEEAEEQGAGLAAVDFQAVGYPADRVALVAMALETVVAAEDEAATMVVAAEAIVEAVATIQAEEAAVDHKQLQIKPRRALTLLELLLALSLSIFVLMAIGMAIQMHYRMLDVRRTNVEDSRIVRQAFIMIANDLKSAVGPVTLDLSGLDAVSGNTAAFAATSALGGAGGDLSGLGGLGGLGGATGGQTGGTGQTGGGTTTPPTGTQTGSGQGGQSGGATGGTSGVQTGGTGAASGGTGAASAAGSAAAGATGEETEESAATSVVGLYGSVNELRFDISRLPRVDQYQSLMTAGEMGATDIPSDIKTVVYFVQGEGSLTSGNPEPTTTGRGKGLMRAELDRAVSSWAEMNGDIDSAYSGAKLLAEEVTGLEFQYFDGATWTPDWNSDEMGGLPVAVEVLLTMQPFSALTQEEIDALADSSEVATEEQTYRLVVRLPTAVSADTRALEAEAEEAAAAEMAASEYSGTQSASSGDTGGTGGTGGGGNTGGGNTGGGNTGGFGPGGAGSGSPGGRGGSGGSDAGGRGGRGGEGGSGRGGDGGSKGRPRGGGGDGGPQRGGGNRGR